MPRPPFSMHFRIGGNDASIALTYCPILSSLRATMSNLPGGLKQTCLPLVDGNLTAKRDRGHRVLQVMSCPEYSSMSRAHSILVVV